VPDVVLTVKKASFMKGNTTIVARSHSVGLFPKCRFYREQSGYEISDLIARLTNSHPSETGQGVLIRLKSVHLVFDVINSGMDRILDRNIEIMVLNDAKVKDDDTKMFIPQESFYGTGTKL